MSTFISDDEQTTNLISSIEAIATAGLVPLIWGPPGIGKTALVRALAARHNLPLHILIPSTMDPADVNGLPALRIKTLFPGTAEEVEVTITENTLQSWAEELLRLGKGILFFDEASTAPPAVQAALLSVLQGRLVSGHTLSDNVWMIAAANNADEAADGWVLAAPLANRFAHLRMSFNQESWLKGMSANFGRVAASEYEQDRQTYERARITAFISSPVGASYGMKMPSSRTEAGLAWPSPRSWDNLANALANVDPDKGDQRAAKIVRHTIIEAFIGQAAANEFLTFTDSLSLPSIADVLRDPSKIDWDNLNSSEVYIIVQSIIPNINASNVNESLAAVVHIVKNHSKHKDVVIGRAFVLIEAMRGIPDGSKLIAGSLREFIPALQKAGMAKG